MKFTATSVALGLASIAFAQNTELKADCSSLPGYDAATNTAGPFEAIAESNGSEVGGLPPINGLTAHIDVRTAGGGSSGSFFVPRQPNSGSLYRPRKATLRCNGGAIQVWVEEYLDPQRTFWADLTANTQFSPFHVGYNQDTLQYPGVPLHVATRSGDPNTFYLASTNDGSASSTFYLKFEIGHRWGTSYTVGWLNKDDQTNPPEFPWPADGDFVGFLKLVPLSS